ncbi:MAG: carboxypeptidase regulatory-like domain-containing protein [bacterium]|nr:carboxypeptidase regulatory-like domain-containing protein [bacterium]
MKSRRIRGLGLSLALLACLSTVVVAQPAEEQTFSRLSGRILGADGKSPAAGVRVIAYHLSTETTYTSEPTSGKGEYALNELPFGYYDLAIETPDGIFVANQVINLPPSGKASANMTLSTFSDQADADDPQRRSFPGSSADPSGLAVVQEKLTGRAFWRSPKGVAIVAGGAAVVLLSVAGGSSSSSNGPPASASQP